MPVAAFQVVGDRPRNLRIAGDPADVDGLSLRQARGFQEAGEMAETQGIAQVEGIALLVALHVEEKRS